MKFNIAVNKFPRKILNWKNRQVTWDDFIERITNTEYTNETVAEYLTFKSDVQDDIKDKGAFVGGYLAGGTRGKKSITGRQLITLDADAAGIRFWESFCLQFDCTAAIYSTHKHTPEKPRYRLVIPLSREVLPDEYIAICRRIAGSVGIEQFDHTGYQPERFMYWPSTSKDGVYIFKQQTGPLLIPDDVLSTYRNWQDVSEWPTGLRENKVLSHDAKVQGEPVDKPGLIGAFNRAYTIPEAIALFLSDVYEESGIENRYTYIDGSTAAGVIVYDDKFSFSHHSTDPTNNILCNAFDLVRLHKYYLLDNDVEGVPVNKRPSYLAMCDFVSDDEFVKEQIGQARMLKAKEAFADYINVPGEEQDIATDWMKKMDMDRKSNFLSTINNIALILEHDPLFKDNIYFDKFEQQPVFKKSIPWRDTTPPNNLIIDSDDANIENHIEKVYKINSGGTKLQKGMLITFEKHKFHPVTNYLSSLKWDGISRIENLLIDYFGAVDNIYTKSVTVKTIVAAVARVFKPGIKFDYILTLVGKEGQGKSQLFDRLGNPEDGGKWFSDSFNLYMLQSKEAFEQIQGVWIVEIGELAGIAKVEVERVKGFVAARQDRYRSPYGRTPAPRPRQCIFVAGTNDFNFLKSQNGNRRFWPVVTYVTGPAKSVYDMGSEEVNQVWAEAVELFKKGEALYLEKDVEQIAFDVQETHTEINPWINIFKEFLEKKIPLNWWDLGSFEKVQYMNTYNTQNKDEQEIRMKTTPYELWDVALNKRDTIDTAGMRQIRQAMTKLINWKMSESNLRFGNFYPRHIHGYERIENMPADKDIIKVNSLLNKIM